MDEDDNDSYVSNRMGIDGVVTPTSSKRVTFSEQPIHIEEFSDEAYNTNRQLING